MFAVDDASAVNPEFAPAAGIIIPYRDEAGQALTYQRYDHAPLFCRVRHLTVPGWPLPRGRRYAQPADSGLQLYIPRGFSRPEAEHGGFVIVEGEKKAIALCVAGIPAVGIGGVWNFGGGDGSALHSTLADLAAHCPATFVAFDSDAATKPGIQQAEWRLAGQIALAGGKPHVVRIPADGESKTGADDYLVKHGAGSLIRLIQAAPQFGVTVTAGSDVMTVADLLRRQVRPVEELIPGIVEKGIPTFIARPSGEHRDSRLLAPSKAHLTGLQYPGRRGSCS